MNTSLIQTAKGRTVLLQHDVVSPRPYSRINMISGTLGTFADYPPRIFFDGKSPLAPPRKKGEDEDWLPVEQNPKKRKAGGSRTATRTRCGRSSRRSPSKSGHGGMDYVMSWRLVECMREGLAPDMDVYDAAAWSAPAALSEQSVARGSAPVEFPDFTRGRWAEKRA